MKVVIRVSDKYFIEKIFLGVWVCGLVHWVKSGGKGEWLLPWLEVPLSKREKKSGLEAKGRS